MKLSLDHLVVAARTLEDGIRWCEQGLGITPGPGGTHGLMGTHNRLFSIASPAFPRAYFEIIAIDPQAPPPGRRRWFDLDDAGLQRVLQHGPRLVHWVARCDDIDSPLANLRNHGIDAGEVLQAERQTANGPLRWKIAVRADGKRLHGGVWPTLIEWGDVHPADTMAASGVTLEHCRITGLPAPLAQHLPATFFLSPPPGGGRGGAVRDEGHNGGTEGAQEADTGTQAALGVTLRTPRGRIMLSSLHAEVTDVQP